MVVLASIITITYAYTQWNNNHYHASFVITGGNTYCLKKVTCDAISDDKVGSMITLIFQCMIPIITYCSCHINMFTAPSPGIIEMHNDMVAFQLKKNASKVSCGLTEDNLFEFVTRQITNHKTVTKWVVSVELYCPYIPHMMIVYAKWNPWLSHLANIS